MEKEQLMQASTTLFPPDKADIDRHLNRIKSFLFGVRSALGLDGASVPLGGYMPRLPPPLNDAIFSVEKLAYLCGIVPGLDLQGRHDRELSENGRREKREMAPRDPGNLRARREALLLELLELDAALGAR